MSYIISLKKSRKWFQFCKEVSATINNQNKEEVLNLYLESISQYHPLTIAETTLKICKVVHSIALLEKSIDTIKECSMYQGDFSVQIIHLEIQKNLFRVEEGDFEGIEKHLFELKTSQKDLPTRVVEIYHFLGFKYFEKTGNLEYAINHLVSYVELSKDETVYSTLARYTLVSPTFFNFLKIYSIISSTSTGDLYTDIYEIVQNGDTKKILEKKKYLEDTFGEDSRNIIEKTHFIKLINLCFKEKSRQISLEKLQEDLGTEIHSFLLRAFGLGLIKGWVDGNILYFSTILPRTLPTEELEKMKEKYSNWRKKVGETIAMIQ
ncbi:26S proteasome non-ATPase regulatory subunit 13 like protein A [Nosema granulosis]|uniref:26S proteasome non-ATPase regulatory subunit 13 like protein A n=1 Tax=Nosema granulosis TaxID=83296 RepID=A0A9P6GVM5_9MICR|nr:26S proteasome non-ATPase regulatory subunit 13 like protein A [Nosema granulosis]